MFIRNLLSSVECFIYFITVDQNYIFDFIILNLLLFILTSHSVCEHGLWYLPAYVIIALNINLIMLLELI